MIELEPPKKRRRQASIEQTPPKSLVVSFSNAALGKRMLSRLTTNSNSTTTTAPSPSTSSTSTEVKSQSIKDSSINKDIQHKFKNPKFTFKCLGSHKKKSWKGLKQILQAEKSASTWSVDTASYSSIDAPPPLKPPKKYSDISGLPAPYTDPATQLYYSNRKEFESIRSLPSHVVEGYLSLRGKATDTQNYLHTAIRGKIAT